MRRRIATIGLAVTLMTLCAACPTPPPSPPRYDLVILGDSISEGTLAMSSGRTRWQDAWADHRAQERGGGVTMRRYTGEVVGWGALYQWDWAISGLSATVFAYWPVRLAGLPRHADEVVLALGANDERQNVPPATYELSLSFLLDYLAPRRCTIVSPWAWRDFWPLADHDEYLRAAERVAWAHRCAWRDMGRVGSPAPEALTVDGIHPSQAGQDRLRASLL